MRSSKKKYNNKPQKRMLESGEVYEFSSSKEAKRYDELLRLQKGGLISNLQLQVPFVLLPAQYEEHIEYTPKTHKEKKVKKLVERETRYVADFVYQRNGETVVEDVKGFKDSTAYSVYVLKRKMLLYFHGLSIHEI